MLEYAKERKLNRVVRVSSEACCHIIMAVMMTAVFGNLSEHTAEI